jgi:protein O-mannosyl-transferase
VSEPTATPDRSTRWQLVAPVLLIAIAAAAAYHNTFSVPELLDDPAAISGNPTIVRLWPISEALAPPSNSGLGGRPFANLTFALNYWWGGLDLRSYHFVNLLIHVSAGLALFGIVRRTLMNRDRDRDRSPARESRDSFESHDAAKIALAIAGLWSVHPVLTTSVTYLSQRTESLMGACYLFALYSFIRGTEKPARGLWLVSSVLACLAGMAAKEVMASAPLVILLYDRTFVAGTFRDALRTRRGYYAGLAATWLLLAGLVTTGLNERHVGFGLGVEWWRYALTESRALLVYARISLWPHPLIFDYGPDFLGWLAALPFVCVITLLLSVTILALRRRPVVGFIAVCPFLLLAPTSSFVPVALQPIAENRVYLPLIAAVTALTIGLYFVGGRRCFPALFAIGLSFVWLSERRNAAYESPLRIWADTVAKRPQNPRAYDNYAQALQLIGRREEAVVQLKKALELNPNSYASHGLLANVYIELSRFDEAIAHYRRALGLKSDIAIFHNNLATSLARVNRIDEAMQHYAEAVRLNPKLPAAHSNFANLLYQVGRTNEAAAHYQTALELKPDDSAARYNLGLMMFQLDRNAEAVGHLQRAIEQNPTDANFRNTFGVALMKTNRLGEAVFQFEECLRLDPQHPHARGNLDDTRKAMGAEAQRATPPR